MRQLELLPELYVADMCSTELRIDNDPAGDCSGVVSVVGRSLLRSHHLESNANLCTEIRIPCQRWTFQTFC